jgi:hypothetical protein
METKMERKTVTDIRNADGYFDATNGKTTVPKGWVHLPAPAGSQEDDDLQSIARHRRIPYARYLSRSRKDGLGRIWRDFTGIVVPAEDAGEIGRTLERIIRGEVEITYGQLREVPLHR